MVSVLTSRVVNREFDYKTLKLVFVASHAALKNKSWLARNQDNVSEWYDMSIYRQLFQ